MIREAMLAVLSPFMNETREGLNDIKRDLEQHKSQTASELADLQSSINNPPLEMISRAVLQKLLPYLNDIEEDLGEKIDESVSSLAEDLEEINKKVCNLNNSLISVNASMREELEDHQLSHEQLMVTLVAVNTGVTEDMNCIKEDLSHLKNNTIPDLKQDFEEDLVRLDEKMSKLTQYFTEYKNQTTSELVNLQHNYNLSHRLLIETIVTVNGTVMEEMSCIKEDLNHLSESLNNTIHDMKEDLKEDLTTPSDNTCNLTEQNKNYITSELANLHTSLQSTIRDIEEDLSEKINESASTLARDLEDINEKVCNLSDREMGSEQRISERIMESHQPILKVVIGNLDNITEAVTAVNDNLEEHKNQTSAKQLSHSEQLTQICAKMDAIGSSVSTGINSIGITAQVEEHSNHVISKLFALQNKQDVIDSKLDLLDSKQDELDMKVMSVTSELEQNVLSNVTTQLQKTSDYLHESHGYTCGGTGGWRRVVYLDMTDPNTNCPSGWQLTGDSKTTYCGRVSTSRLTCDSVIFPVSGGAYTSVCGTIRAYQNGSTDAFEAFHTGQVTSIDGAYVSGVSLTYGSPRQHIWTFAAGATESESTHNNACPCDATIDITIPSFVGGDYFCESGSPGRFSNYRAYDPLWDGKNCTSNSTCCSFNNPQYFTKQLFNRTSDDIEARICQMGGGDDIPIEFIELYVKVDEVNINELEQNVLNNVTKELQRTYDTIHKDLEQVEHNIISELKTLHGGTEICGGTGGWRRVAYLDMRDNSTNCPSGWQLTRHSKRTCGRVGPHYRRTCDSVIFPVSGGAYTSVCGTIRGYQYDITSGFEPYDNGEVTTIDGAYVSGISLTHGSPRQHIWTFAAGVSENIPTHNYACPCDATIEIDIPPFVGGDYFCESGVNSIFSLGFHPDDPLWDGEGCTNSSTCCSFNNPPYFTKQLSNHTTDDIEVRLCNYRGATPLEFLELYVKVDDVNIKEFEHNVLNNVTKELQRTYDTIHKDLEQVGHNITSEVKTLHGGPDICGGTGGWRRVAHLDMRDNSTNCPSGWQLTGHSKRTCGRVSRRYSLTCDSVIFPVSGGAYTSVCGTIRAYQYDVTAGFRAYDAGLVTTIDGAYVSGVSLTHGSPRQHIWTFAAGVSENMPTHNYACPCDATIEIDIPPFVGGDYFCESGVNSIFFHGFHPDDPLWDGEGCTNSSTCCSFNNPPYFTKQLSNHTTDDIEVRLCDYRGDTPLEFLELYVKVDEVNIKELEQNVLNNVTKELQRTYDTIHKDLEQVDHNITSELKTLHGGPDICGGTGGWRRVAHLDMRDNSTNCPSGWQLTGHSKRTCGRVSRRYSLTCDSVIFPVSGGAYTSVCGTIRGYQYDITTGFEAYDDEVTTIDDAYVSGVSLTHSSPRQHIWTFAAGYAENRPTVNYVCPCDATIDIDIPPFVGGDYFCESGVNSGYSYGFHSDDPLWDGEGCTNSSTCCSFNKPPYFTKQLLKATTDAIEVRLCHWGRDDTPIEFIELYVKVDDVNIKELEHNVLDNVTKELQKNYDKLHEDLEQVEHNVTTNVTKELYTMHKHVCGGTGGWRRVVYLDMTDPNTDCPSGWQLTEHSKRTCGKVSTGDLSCDSVIFPVSGGAYTSVCGTIRAYQYGHKDAFEVYDAGRVTTIDGAYVAGVSLTHGSPRQHIWTFAAGASEAYNDNEACPCDTTTDIDIPPFVGGDYFCESGVSSGSTSGFHHYDPLWDGGFCTSNSTCCSFNNPPYFTKQLPNPTTDDIEARLCRWEHDEDSPVEFIELYVK